MQVMRGKHRGHGRIIQDWRNAWISAVLPHGKQVIVSPWNVRLSPAERAALQDSYESYQAGDPGTTGTFWRSWELRPDGTFRYRDAAAASRALDARLQLTS